MRTLRDPQQTPLFDPFDPVLTERTRQALLEGWQGVFRYVLLELMPVEALGGSFHPSMGRPTKELYSMAGLLVIKAFMDWTEEEAVTAYRFHLDVHYALNLDPKAEDLSLRTLQRYTRLFVDNDLASEVMHTVTTTLVQECGIRIDQQRLDSTHVFSDMASFGRTRMMGVTVKRFLTQLKRHDRIAYQSLDEELRQRYTPSVHQLFGNRGKDEASRRLQRQQVAEDMHELIRRFADHPEHPQRTTYQMLERVFHEQCVVSEEQVTLKSKTGGDVVQNPSDPDATYDGHKGQGYQVQIAETCHPDNEVQLLSAAVPQTAAASDTAALPEVLDELEANQLLPESLLADTLYGSDDNVQHAKERGVELVAPTKEGARQAEKANTDTDTSTNTDTSTSTNTNTNTDTNTNTNTDTDTSTSTNTSTDTNDDRLTLDDFTINAATETVERCPEGHAPERCVTDPNTGKTTTTMPAEVCSQCPSFDRCPMRQVRKIYRLEHTAKQRRLAARRREEQTDAFRDRYRRRGGIEGTNSGIKRRTGMGRVRVRGKTRVFSEILLRLAGWNILRAAACPTLWKRVAERAQQALAGVCFSPFLAYIGHFELPEALPQCIRRRYALFSVFSHEPLRACA